MPNISTTTTKPALLVAAVLLLIAALLFGTGSGPAGAEFPSGKSTVNVADQTLVEWTEDDDWNTILDSQIKPPGGNRALFIDVSLVCGLYTQTLVESDDTEDDGNGNGNGGGNDKDSTSAQATVEVRVLLNGEQAEPGEVVFCDRYQELSADLQGKLEFDEEEGELVITDPEIIELVQRTQSANAFNFVAHPLDSGETYDIEVQSRVATEIDDEDGEASAQALVGKGSVTVDAVRLVKDDQVMTTDDED